MSFSFAHPWLLALLALVPLMVWLRRKAAPPAALVYSSTQLLRGMANLARVSIESRLLALRCLALVLLTVALAQPRLNEGETISKESGIDIVICIDLSGSMNAEDFELNGVPVNRLVIAKDTLRKFVSKRSGDRIGLVAFAGRAYIAAPLTLDHTFLLSNLDRLELGSIEDGTAIGSGLTAGLNRLKDLKAKSKIVILMTDGQNNAGKVPPMAAAEAAEALQVKVYTIGVGTRGIAYVPYVNTFGQKMRVQQKVDIDEETLTAMAKKTGGRYFRADNTQALQNIYSEIDKLEKTEVEIKRFQRYRELYQWFGLAGLVSLLLDLILAHTVWRRLP